jgi:polyphosphate kinase
VEALYEASQAGVEIDLLVRGICSLRPGVKGLSERIRVRSIVGRFLEHSRIFYFANGGEEVIYCGSADWMPRNLFERCEVLFPIKDAQLRARLKDEILAAYLADTAKTRILEPDGDYIRARGGKVPFSAQDFFMQLAEGRVTVDNIPPPVETHPPKIPASPRPSKAPTRKKTPGTIVRARMENATAPVS